MHLIQHFELIVAYELNTIAILYWNINKRCN